MWLLLCFATSTVGWQQKVSPLPPMGWSSWCTESGIVPCLTDFCNEREILDIANSMSRSGLLSLGFDHILLDDCWAGQARSADGTITEDRSRFPSGMKNFTAQLHALGFKLGLYTDVGQKTCRGGRLGSWPHYEQDANTFAVDWEIDYVKMDWCHHPAGFTQQQLYTNFSNALKNTRRDIFFSICGWGLNESWKWAPAIANLWRTGPDHIPVWYLKNGTQDAGHSGGTSNIIQQMANLSSFTAPFHFNDPDYLEIEPYNSEREVTTQVSFWVGIFAAPFVVANDVRQEHVAKYLRNKEVIAVSQDPLVRAGDLRIGAGRAGQVWSRVLQDGWAVVAYNANVNFWDASVSVSVPLDASVLIGLSSSATFTIRNLWEQETLSTSASGSFNVGRLAPKQSVLLRITPNP